MKTGKLQLLYLAIAILIPYTAIGATISFSSISNGGGIWTNNYRVTAAGDEPQIKEFSIFFDPQSYSNISLAGIPTNWDGVIIQPDTSIPSDGFFDALALSGGSNSGAAINGFSISFLFNGLTVPGSQRFEVVDPATFATLATGFTTTDSGVILPNPGPIPQPPNSDVSEPKSIFLLLLGFVLFVISHRRGPGLMNALYKNFNLDLNKAR